MSHRCRRHLEPTPRRRLDAPSPRADDEVRWGLTRRVRREIARGEYVTRARLEATAARLLADLGE